MRIWCAYVRAVSKWTYNGSFGVLPGMRLCAVAAYLADQPASWSVRPPAHRLRRVSVGDCVTSCASLCEPQLHVVLLTFSFTNKYPPVDKGAHGTWDEWERRKWRHPLAGSLTHWNYLLFAARVRTGREAFVAPRDHRACRNHSPHQQGWFLPCPSAPKCIGGKLHECVIRDPLPRSGKSVEAAPPLPTRRSLQSA